VPGVDAVSSSSGFGGIYQDPKNFFATFAVDPQKFLNMFPEVIVSPETKEKWIRKRTGAIVGRQLLEKFKWKIGDHVPLTSPIWGQPANQANWDFEIVGVYDTNRKSTDKSQFFFRYDYFDEARTQAKGKIGWMTVRVKNADDATRISKQIDKEFANSPEETKAEPEGAFAASFAQQVGDIGTIVTGVVSAVFFTILLVAGNTVSQSVNERTEELGVLKAMGFTNRLVLILVLAESCAIALLGGLAGLGLALGITLAGNPIPNVLPNLEIPNRDVVTGVLLAIGLGLLSGALPAIHAMRLQIAVALRRNA
jgi:putative ABC transport system permease protein